MKYLRGALWPDGDDESEVMNEVAKVDGVADVLSWDAHASLEKRTLYAGELKGEPAKMTRPQSDKARECPGRKRRIVKVTQWSASARANMIRALRERVT